MKIVQKGNYSGDIIKTVLENRNIPNLELFLNPEQALESDPFEFMNSEKGRSLLFKHLEKGSDISILVDADADGYTSSTIMYRYLMDLRSKSKISYIVHDRKAHGLTDRVMEELAETKPGLVIVPDAGSNDIAKIEELEKNGINILIIDHHVVSEFTDKGVIINNQLCPITNHQLVGAGVIYKFLQGFDKEYGFNKVDNYLDLVAVGQIGDSSDISNPEIRKLVLKGLENIKNPFLKVAIGQDLGFVKLTPKDLSFGVIPMINAVTRVGSMEERELLFEAMAGIGEGRIFAVEKKKKNKDTGKFDKISLNYNIYEYGYDLCTKAKNRQASVTKKLTPIIEKNMLDCGGIIIAFTGDDEYPGITGLIANKLVNKYEKPVLLLNETEDSYTGSGRGHEKTIKDFRKWCENSNLVEFAQGHDNAFGIGIRKDKLDDFKNYSKTLQKTELIYEVDLITDKPNKDLCEIIDKNRSLFGGSVSEPIIGIIGLTVPKRFISVKGQMLTIWSYGITMIQFSASNELIDSIFINAPDIFTFNIVGSYSMNNWGGRITPQLIIKDIEIVFEKEEEINEDNIIF